MESDSIGKDDKQKKESGDYIPNDSDIPESFGIFRTFCSGDEIVRGLLDYNIYILCVCGPILLGLICFA